MDLYCIICGGCSWNKLGNENYNTFIENCKDMSQKIINNNITVKNPIIFQHIFKENV